MTMARKSRGTLALLGGGEWQEGCRPIDEYLLEVSGASEVVVLPTAAAYERSDLVVERAVTWFEALGVKVRPVMVLNRRDAQDDANVKALKGASFVYLSDGSPLHLRSVLKESSLLAVLVAGYRNGGVLAASGAG
ncbi:MAG TPA: Type 1 glutamine amidotransferase-like domain-containing protein, partial [Acidimicrobiia bacterium]